MGTPGTHSVMIHGAASRGVNFRFSQHGEVTNGEQAKPTIQELYIL